MTKTTNWKNRRKLVIGAAIGLPILGLAIAAIGASTNGFNDTVLITDTDQNIMNAAVGLIVVVAILWAIGFEKFKKAALWIAGGLAVVAVLAAITIFGGWEFVMFGVFGGLAFWGIRSMIADAVESGVRNARN